ncbi:hypothetical protein [Pedobacter ginsengisoli]|uniref:hypothetical protein n=1 Tax=Pedobacter ginsengisoli TaxID=363852 RepID=UPI00254C735B|nr:hypothetical protein [Pedobacter ginsengisoli]
MKNTFKLIFAFLIMGSLLASCFGLPPQYGLACGAGLLGVAIATYKEPMQNVFRADVINPDITKIATYIGKVRKGIIPKLVNAMNISKDISLVPNIKNVSVSTSLTIKSGPKPATGNFNPMAGDLDYNPRLLTVEAFQRDLLITPSLYRKSHFAYERGAGEGTNNKSIPFEAYTLKRVLENDAAILNDQTGFYGVGKAAFAAFNAGSVYTAGQRVYFTLNGEVQYFTAKATTTAGQSPATNPEKWTESNALAICLGLGTQLFAGRTSGDITKVIAAGSLSAYDLYKKVFRAHSDARKNLGVVIYSPTTKTEELYDDFETKVGKYTENDGSGNMYLAGTNKKGLIVPATWMSKSNVIFSGPKENFEMGTDLLSDMESFNVIQDVYSVKMGMSGVMGFNYQDGSEITMTDAD